MSLAVPSVDVFGMGLHAKVAPDSPATLFGRASGDEFLALAVELILGVQGHCFRAASPELARKIRMWHAEEERSEQLCAKINREADRCGLARELVEFVSEPQLVTAVAAHAAARGEIVVKAVLPELFAIIAPARQAVRRVDPN